MTVTNEQVRLLMSTHERTRSIETASAKAGMCRQTGAKYLKSGKDAENGENQPRDYRTRQDPLEGIWPEAEEKLEAAPELEAKALFEWLQQRYPNTLNSAQLRTFQRRVRRWRALKGPDKAVYFPQQHFPGRRMAVDFTSMNELGITINGEAFEHMLCHTVLTYSNWQWGTICHSESLQALRTGIQTALFRLGRVPEEIWSDNSTAATHNPALGNSTEREFNQRYLDMVQHFGMKPHTIQPGQSHENGDVESSNGHLKRRIEQHLLLRGSREFNSREAYCAFLQDIFDKANDLQTERIREELDSMAVLQASRLTEWDEERCRVKKWSTITVRKNTYAVPSRLIDETVTVRVYEDHLEVYYADICQQTMPRLRGHGKAYIDYRNIIASLVRKPGAFRNYRYRDQLFPTRHFRKAYDVLCENCSARLADQEYVRILKLAADRSEQQVNDILHALLAEGTTPRWGTVEEFMPARDAGQPPAVEIPRPDLSEYDQLIGGDDNE